MLGKWGRRVENRKTGEDNPVRILKRIPVIQGDSLSLRLHAGMKNSQETIRTNAICTTRHLFWKIRLISSYRTLTYNQFP